jgi:urease accessory protein
MLSVTKILPRGQGLAAVLLKRAPSVELDWARRGASPLDATDSSGRPLHVALPPGSRLRDGDVLIAEDGSLVRVVAAPEPVLAVQACPTHGSPADLLRAAHALGRLQVAAMVQLDRLLIAPDAALAGRLRHQHLVVQEAVAPFEPDLTLLTDAAPATAPPPAAAHVHGPHCSHGHDHHQHRHHDHHSHAGHGAPGHTHPTAAVAAAVAAPPRGRPVGVAVTGAAVPHVHGPGCGHAHTGR